MQWPIEDSDKFQYRNITLRSWGYECIMNKQLIHMLFLSQSKPRSENKCASFTVLLLDLLKNCCYSLQDFRLCLFIGLNTHKDNCSISFKVKTATCLFGDPYVTRWTVLLTIITKRKTLLYKESQKEHSRPLGIILSTC